MWRLTIVLCRHFIRLHFYQNTIIPKCQIRSKSKSVKKVEIEREPKTKIVIALTSAFMLRHGRNKFRIEIIIPLY